MKYEIGVLVVASRDDGKVLFARRTYAFLDYVLPGGGVDHGESPFEAAVREVREETGYLVDPEGLRHIGTCVIPGRNEITFIITGRTSGKSMNSIAMRSPLSDSLEQTRFRLRSRKRIIVVP